MSTLQGPPPLFRFRFLAIALGAVACAGPGCVADTADDAPDADLAASEQSVEVQTACTAASGSDDSADTCNGGWSYRPSCELADRSCGVARMECRPENYGTCNAWLHVAERRTIEWMGDPFGPGQCSGVSLWKEAIKAAYPELGLSGKIFYVEWDKYDAGKAWRLPERWDVLGRNMADMDAVFTVENLRGLYETGYCRGEALVVAKRRPTAACSCRRETPVYKACPVAGSRCTPTKLFSPGSVRKSQLAPFASTHASDAAECMSCDDVSDFRGKLTCLNKNLAATSASMGVVRASTDVTGSDRRHLRTATAQACVQACNLDSGCGGATYNPTPYWWESTCVLKGTDAVAGGWSWLTSYVKSESGAAAAARDAIVAQLKLTLELQGDQSTEADRASIRPLYTSDASARNSCSPNEPLSSRHPSLASIVGIGGVSVRYCEALQQSHVAPALRAIEFRRCADLLDTLAQRTSDPEVASELFDLLGSLYGNQLAAMETSHATREPWFQLAVLDSYYTHLQRIATAAARQADVAGAVEVGTSAMWSAAYAAGAPAPELMQKLGLAGGSGAIRAAIMAEFGEKSRSAAAGMLVAAMTSRGGIADDGLPTGGYPVGSGVLRKLLGDGLKELSLELDKLSGFHDLGCAVLGDCNAAPGGAALVGYWNAIAGLDSDSALTNAVDTYGAALGEWLPAFEAMGDNHAQVAAALADSDASVRTDLGATLLHGTERATSFAVHGVFDATALRTLSVGVDRTKREAVLAATAQALDRLNQSSSSYEAGLDRLISAGAAKLETDHLQERLVSERARRQAEHDQLVGQLANIQTAIDASNKAFGSIMTEWTKIDHTVSDAALTEIAASPRPVQVPSNAGRHTRGWSERPASLAFDPDLVIPDLAVGSVLTVDASGTYSPACAISNVRMLSPNGLGSAVGIGAAECGPEGYRLTSSAASYQAASNSSESRQTGTVTVGARAEVCASAGIWGSAVGVEAKACGYVDTNMSWSKSDIESNSEGTESRTQASFSGGLRLPEVTPYPFAPTGALLVVLSGPDGEAYDLHPISTGQSSIVIPRADTTATFVVNDLGGCGGMGPSNLTVSWRALIGEREVAAAVVRTMNDVMGQLKASLRTYVAQGTVPGAQASELRARAMLDLREAMPDARAVPRAAQELFEAFLDKELANLERRVQIRNLEDRIDLLRMDLATADLQRRQAETAGTVREMLAHLAVRHLDSDLVSIHVRDAIGLVHSKLMPVLDLWYPSVVPALRNDRGRRAKFEALRTIDLSTTTYELGERLRLAIAELQSAYTNASLGHERAPAQAPRIAAIAIPRPGTEPIDGGLGGDDGGLGGFDPNGPPISEFFSVVDEARASVLWNAIERKDWGLVDLRPEDLYGALDGQINCYTNVPVIEHVGLFVIRPYASDNYTLNQALREFDVEASPAQPFPTAEGWNNYNLENGIWSRYELPIFYGSATEVLNVFDTNPRIRTQPPVGLSVFGDFEIDFRALRSLEAAGARTGFDDEATALVLTFRLSTRPGERLDWVQTCGESIMGFAAPASGEGDDSPWWDATADEAELADDPDLQRTDATLADLEADDTGY